MADGNEFRKDFAKKLKEAHEHNCKILHSFEESIERLKKTELHPSMKNEKQKVLMDVYYSESHMRNWSETCTRSEESLFEKIDKLEQSLNAFQQQSGPETARPPETKPTATTTSAESKELISHLENFLNEKEPLIISMLSTLADDLRSFHGLMKLEGLAAVTEEKLNALQDKCKTHKELIDLMKEHQKELDGLLRAFVKTKLSNARNIGLILRDTEGPRNQLRAIINGEAKKALTDIVNKVKADFVFLLNPGLFPGAYVESLKEIVRRSAINNLLAREAKKLSKIIEHEQAQRQSFVDAYGKLLPGNFATYLKTVQVPVSIHSEEVKDMQEIHDPELERGVDMAKITGEFEGHREADLEKETDELRGKLEKGKADYLVQKEALKKELEEIQKDFEQQKADNISVQSSLHSKISELDFALQMKADDIAKLHKTIKTKEERIDELEREEEKLHRLSLEMTNGFKDELARKQLELEKKEKEMHNILVDLQNYTLRKKNCAFCGELIEFKGNKDDYLAEINQKMLEKTAQVRALEDKVDQFSKMMSVSSASLFNLMSSKVNEREQKLRTMRQEYEQRLMESEEYLASEHDKCAVVTKQKVAALNEKVAELERAKEKEVGEMARQNEKAAAVSSAKIQQLEARAAYFEKESKKSSSSVQSLSCAEKSLKLEIEQLKRDARIRKDVLSQKESLIRQLHDQKQTLSKECTEAKMASESLEVIKETLRKEIESWKSKAETRERETEKVTLQLKELETRTLGLEAKLADKADQLANVEASKQKEERMMAEKGSERLRSVEEKLLVKEKELERMAAAEAKLKSKELEYAGVELRLVAKEKELAQSLHELERLRRATEQKDKEIVSLKAELDQAKRAKIELELRTQSDLREKAEMIERMKGENARLQVATSTPSGNEEAERKLKERVRELETQLAAKELRVKDLLAAAEETKREMEKRLAAVRQEAETKREEAVTALRKSLENLKGEMNAKEKQLESETRTLMETRSKLESFERQVSEHQKLKETWEGTRLCRCDNHY